MMISRVLSRSFKNRFETGFFIKNIFDSNLASVIKRRHLNDPIGERLARIVDTEHIIHVMTNNTLGMWTFITPVAMIIKGNSQKVMGELITSSAINEFIEIACPKQWKMFHCSLPTTEGNVCGAAFAEQVFGR